MNSTSSILRRAYRRTRGACRVFWFMSLLAAAGCASYQVAGQVQAGRRALLMNDPQAALAYFVPASQVDPNYIFSSGNFRESVWTYVGRAQYDQKKYDEARRSFERALAVYKDDAMAQLYLGLALARTRERAEGLRQIQLGLKGIYDWIEFLNRSRAFYAFWDPRGDIRKEIDKTLALTSGEQTESINLILESAEWIGRQMEEEIDKVRTDERREFQRDLGRGGRGGVGVGIGIGF
jgi:tetratricopeptide (TPR) repeat protein